MRMPGALSMWLLAAVLIALSIDASLFLIWSCSQPSYIKLIGDAGGSCTEYWFNRYQTFIAAIIAIAGAAVTVNTMWRQTERASADAALNTLNRYAATLQTIYNCYDNSYQDEMLRKLEMTANSTEARVAMADNLLGPDQDIFGAFLDRAISAARLKRSPANSDKPMLKQVVPLYKACIESLFYRKHHLQNGGAVADLYGLSLIDRNELTTAWEENRRPNLQVATYPGTVAPFSG